MKYTLGNLYESRESEPFEIAPASIPSIIGSQTVCSGQAVSLSVVVAGSAQSFTVGWQRDQAVAGSGNLLSASQPGVYRATVTDAQGCVATSVPFLLSQVASPNAQITATSSDLNGLNLLTGGTVLLTASNAPGLTYQWYLNGQALSGATSVSYTAAQIGTYTVDVTRNGCTTVSDPATVQLVLANEPVAEGMTLTVLPNPTDGQIRAVLTLETPAPAIFRLTDGTGRRLQSWSFDRPVTRHEQRIDISNAPGGLYFLQAEVAGKTIVSKIVKQ